MSRGLGAAVSIHQHSTYLGNAVQNLAKKPKHCQSCPKELTISGPKTGKVKQWIVFSGSSPPGSITLWSQAHRETKPFYPDKQGIWRNTLWFSKPGIYDIYAKSGNLTASAKISIVP